MRDYQEKLIWQEYDLILGIDEAGRGPWAGPLLAAGVVYPKYFNNIPKSFLELIDDSKKLKAEQREELFNQIIDYALAYAIVKIDVEEIDKIGIGEANRKIVFEVFKEITKQIKINFVVVDYVAKLKFPNDNYAIFKKGDQKFLSIASASILAKVTRDQLMENYYNDLYPEYKFYKHKGYGTKEHRVLLDKYGLSPIHRRSFSPMKKML